MLKKFRIINLLGPPRRIGAKKLWSARYDDFPPRRTLRLSGFAACPAELRGALFLFSFLLLAKACLL
ncbi:MAG: hypothetical protein RLZ13_934 [Bacteroidota bacterium]